MPLNSHLIPIPHNKKKEKEKFRYCRRMRLVHRNCFHISRTFIAEDEQKLRRGWTHWVGFEESYRI